MQLHHQEKVILKLYYMQCQMPYSKQEVNILEYTSEIGSTLATVQCTYEYNHFYPEYEQSILGKSIKFIPNMYLIQAYQNFLELKHTIT